MRLENIQDILDELTPISVENAKIMAMIKKELERKTPMNPATDAEAVNNLNFKTFKAMIKKATMRSKDNAQGDKTPPKTGK